MALTVSIISYFHLFLVLYTGSSIIWREVLLWFDYNLRYETSIALEILSLLHKENLVIQDFFVFRPRRAPLQQFLPVLFRDSKMKKILFLASFLFLCNLSSTQEPVQGFDYKCVLCKFTAQLIIDYHNEGASPKSLFKVLSILCSYLGGQDKVINQN